MSLLSMQLFQAQKSLQVNLFRAALGAQNRITHHLACSKPVQKSIEIFTQIIALLIGFCNHWITIIRQIPVVEILGSLFRRLWEQV